MKVTIDSQYLISTLADLVQIDSTNPSLAAGGAGEAEIATYVATVLNDLGLVVNNYEVQPGRWNVLGILPGQGSGPSLLLNAHMDTVGVEGMVEPFSAAVHDGRLYGRGSYDMKGSLAAMIAVAKALVEAGARSGLPQGSPLQGDLFIAAVADEEHGSIGSAQLVREVRADGAIVAEPTDLAIGRAHRGFIWYEVETIGRAAHGSRYQEGIDANMRMGRFLAELDKLEQALLARHPHPLVGPPSLHAALLQGGTELSTYAAHCRLQLERRTIPGETEAGATAELQALIDRLAAGDATFNATVKPFFQRQPFEVSPDATIVRAVAEAATNRLGRPPAQVGLSFWTDAALLAEAGIETALIGPAGHGLHSAEEWVDLQSVIDLAYILAETAIIFCARSPDGTSTIGE